MTPRGLLLLLLAACGGGALGHPLDDVELRVRMPQQGSCQLPVVDLEASVLAIEEDTLELFQASLNHMSVCFTYDAQTSAVCKAMDNEIMEIRDLAPGCHSVWTWMLAPDGAMLSQTAIGFEVATNIHECRDSRMCAAPPLRPVPPPMGAPSISTLAPRNGATVVAGALLELVFDVANALVLGSNTICLTYERRGSDGDGPAAVGCVASRRIELALRTPGTYDLRAAVVRGGRLGGEELAATTLELRVLADEPSDVLASSLRREGFNTVYRLSHWTSMGGRSGEGSQVEVAAGDRATIEDVVLSFGLGSMFDAGCGSFYWQPAMLDSINAVQPFAYTGGDIVDTVIAEHNAHRATALRQFYTIDLVTDDLPPPGRFDLVLCRHVLFHNTLSAVMRILNRISLSGSRYLLATTGDFAPGRENRDADVGDDKRSMLRGGFRPLDLSLPPFNLTPVLRRRSRPAGNGDEFLALYELPLPLFPDDLIQELEGGLAARFLGDGDEKQGEKGEQEEEALEVQMTGLTPVMSTGPVDPALLAPAPQDPLDGIAPGYARMEFSTPLDQEVVGPEVLLRFSVMTAERSAFLENAAAGQVVTSVDGVEYSRDPITTATILVRDLARGWHTLESYIEGPQGQERLSTSAKISVRVAGAQELADRYEAALREAQEAAKEEPQGEWFLRMRAQHPQVAAGRRPPARPADCGSATGTPPLMAVGIKTAPANVAVREAMRSTWMAPDALPSDVRAFFLLGQPPAGAHVEALELEQALYGDLLMATDYEDSYFNLVAKTTGFMQVATECYSQSLGYVMVVDDDAYVRMDMLMVPLREGPRPRFYAGQVWAAEKGMPLRAIREEGFANYLSEADYPMAELPPFAIGPHYVVGIDCARFVAENRHRLQGVGTLEDVSMSLWLLAMGVQPEHLAWFSNAKDHDCVENLVSFSDLTAAAIRQIHGNVQSGRAFCHGWSPLWRKGGSVFATAHALGGKEGRGQQQDVPADARRLLEASSSAPILVGMTDAAAYSEPVVRSLLAAAYPAATVVVERTPSYEPHLFVMSALEGGCVRTFHESCVARLSGLAARYSQSVRVVWSGEPMDLSMVAPGTAHVAVDTKTEPRLLVPAPVQLYLPEAAGVFAGLGGSSGRELLDGARRTSKLRFCAYLYYTCEDRRELFFDQLSAMEPVTALGACRGAAAGRSPVATDRVEGGWAARAVEKLRPFKFAIAFENARHAGYVTEKIVLPMLADAVPIYSGPPEVASFFNPAAFINCNDFATTMECAARVVQVHRTPRLYRDMQAQPRMTQEAWERLMSWHEDSPNVELATAFREALVGAVSSLHHQ